MGQITSEILKKLAPGTPKAKRDRFLPYFNEVLPRYGITSQKRVAAYLATVIMESDYLKATEEYASGQAYDITVNRKKALGLGNTEKGDGVKYKGRTLIQTTGKNNYQRVSDILGVDFVANPKKLAEPRWAVEGACIYWKDNKLNAYADKGEFFAIQGLVNRGSATKRAKDYDKREAIYNTALEVIPANFKLEAETPVEEAPVDTNVQADIPQPVIVTDADKVQINEAGAPDEKDAVKVSVDGSNVSVETNTTPGIKEKVAVVAAPKPSFFQRIYAKIVAAITGNALFTFIMDKLDNLSGIKLSPTAWDIIIGLVALGTFSWLIWEMFKVHQERKRQHDLDKILVEQNSTANNLVQLVSQDDAALFAARGWKIVNRGEKLPSDVAANLAQENASNEKSVE